MVINAYIYTPKLNEFVSYGNLAISFDSSMQMFQCYYYVYVELLELRRGQN